MDVPYPVYNKANAPVIADRTIVDGESLTITLVSGDPDGGLLNLVVSDCPIELSPQLNSRRITFNRIPGPLRNVHCNWLNEQPKTKFYRHDYTITGAAAVAGNHTIYFQIVDDVGGENWVRADILVDVTNSPPLLIGGVL